MIQYYTRFFAFALGLYFAQILIFDHVNLFGFANPAVYVAVLLLYRLDMDQFGFLLLAFFYGLLLDLITQTAGAHTIACLTTAFVRPKLAQFSFGNNVDNPANLFTQTLTNNRLLYLGLMLLIHQLLFAFMAYFSWQHAFRIVLYGVTNALFSFLVIAPSISLFRPKK